MNQISFLYESIFLNIASTTDLAKGEQAYALLFTGDWDSSAYTVGYAMADLIDKKLGRGELNRLIGASNPIEFVNAYLTLEKQSKDDPNIPHFSDRFVAAVQRLDGSKIPVR
jgi:hypothetical protein